VLFDSKWLKDTLHLTDDEAAALGVSKYDGMILFGQLYQLDAEQLTRLAQIVFAEDDMVQMLTAADHSYTLQSYIEELGYDLEVVEQITYSSAKHNPEHDSLLAQLFEAHQVGVTDLVVKISEKFSKFLSTLPGHESKLEVMRLGKVNRRTGLPVSQRARIEYSNLLPNLLIIDVSSSQGRTLIESVVDDCIALAVKYDMHLAIVSHTAEWYVPGTYDRDSVMNSPCMMGGTRYAALAEIGVASQQWGTVVCLADIDGQRSDMTAWEQAGGSIDQVIDISTVAGQTWLSEIVNVQAPGAVQQLVVAPVTQAARLQYEQSEQEFHDMVDNLGDLFSESWFD
jgi:hypothetical protein